MGNNKKPPKWVRPKKNGYFGSLRELATHLNMSVHTLNDYTRRDLIKKKSKGWYSGDVVKIMDRIEAEYEEVTESLDETKMSPKELSALEEKRTWEAKIKKLMYEEMCGRLLDREQVFDDATVVLRTVRHKLSRMPKELKTPLSRLTNPDDIEDRLAEELAKRLNELADWVESYQKGEDDDEN
jgi:DNA-binding transcriptional MerR regulator